MDKRTAVFFLTLLVCGTLTAAAQVAAPANNKSVTLSTEEVEEGRQLIAENTNPFSVTLTVDVSGTNFTTDRRLPLTVVLKARETSELTVISLKEEGKDMEFQVRSTWVIGNVIAQHDDSYVYRLPFQNGRQYRVGQSYNGSFSHQGAQRYSVDFMMDEGTPVVAAREGIVAKAVERFREGGADESFKKKANYVLVEHDDGTLAEYAHLKQNGVLTEVGVRVAKGQVIGLSGNTGYSTGPHLHFMVFKIRSDGSAQSLPVRVRTTRGIVSDFNRGEEYRQ